MGLTTPPFPEPWDYIGITMGCAAHDLRIDNPSTSLSRGITVGFALGVLRKWLDHHGIDNTSTSLRHRITKRLLRYVLRITVRIDNMTCMSSSIGMTIGLPWNVSLEFYDLHGIDNTSPSLSPGITIGSPRDVLRITVGLTTPPLP